MKKTILVICGLILNQLSFSQNHQVLYGMTSAGGTQNNGVIFQYDFINNVYTKKHDVFGGTPGGGNPSGSLVRATNGKLYGFMSNGGMWGAGVLFQFTISTSTYLDLWGFDNGSYGGYPYGGLMQSSDGKLYGMTSSAGSSDGNILSWDISAGSFGTGLIFNNVNGSVPFGDLIQATDGKLYGMTSSGCLGYGNIFQYTPSNTSTPLLSLYSFDFFANGGSPHGALLQASDGTFWGMTSMGGANSAGVLFQYDLANAAYTKKFDFSTADGSSPYGGLVQTADGKFYGLTSNGGANGKGVLFQYDPATSTYTKKHEFTSATGSNPNGSLLKASDGNLYGMAYSGGANGYGVIFQYNPAASTYTKKIDFDNTNGANPANSKLIELSVPVGIDENGFDSYVSVYPNPSNGKLMISMNEINTSMAEKKIEIYDLLGNIILQSNLVNSKSEFDLSLQPKGIYFAKIFDGEKIYQGKIVVQ